MHSSRLLIAAAVIVCAACAHEPILTSTPAGTDPGIAYYLPKRLVKIQVDRTPAPDAKDVAKAKADFTAAKTAAAKAKEDLEGEQALLAELGKASTTSDEYKKQAAVVGRATARANLAKKDQDDAQEAIGKAEAAVLLGKGGSGFVDKVTVTLLPPVADTTKRFVAAPEHRQTRNDQLALKTNSSGLLTNSDATAEDQTAAIVVSLAGAVSAAIGVPLTPPSGGGIEKAPAAPSPCGASNPAPPRAPMPFSVEYTLDPTDAKEMGPSRSGALATPTTPFEQRLCSLGANYRFGIAAVGKSSAGGVANSGAAGLFYRRELPYLLTIYTSRGDDPSAFVIAKTIMLSLPNESPLEMVTLESGTFTTRTFSTIFENGILVSHTEAKPSEALAIARIPVEVMKAIFEIPTSLIQLKVNYASKDKELVTAQKDLVEALKALEAAKPKTGGTTP